MAKKPSRARILMTPALCAAKFNPDCKTKYDAVIKAGKPAKVALTAIMRKLIALADALLAITATGRLFPLDQHGQDNARRNRLRSSSVQTHRWIQIWTPE